MSDRRPLKLYKVEVERTYRTEAYVVADSYGAARARMIDADVIERLHQTGERIDDVDVLEITPAALELHTKRTGNRLYLFGDQLPHTKNCYCVAADDESALVTVAEGHRLAGLVDSE